MTRRSAVIDTAATSSNWEPVLIGPDGERALELARSSPIHSAGLGSPMATCLWGAAQPVWR